METKSLRFELKDLERGEVEAVIATFNVRDADGDITLPGAFEDGAPVRISAYGHASWQDALPVGKGVIVTSETDARVRSQFFLNTFQGREHFELLKSMGDLQEWSYGFDAIEWEMGQTDGERVRYLKKLKVYEASPVLVGAGIATRTVSIKSAPDANNAEEGESPQLEAARRAIAREYLRFLKTRERLRARIA